MAGRTVSTITLNPTIDIALVVQKLMANHKMLAIGHRRDPGGGGVNVARSLCRLEVDARAVITTGGAPGLELRTLLAAEGVRTVPLPIDALTRESVSVRDASTESQYRVVVSGPEIDDAPGLLESIASSEQGRDIVVISGRLNPGLPADTYRRLAERLAGATVVIDCPQPSLGEVIQGWCSLVKPNRRELLSLVGRDAANDHELIEVAEEVLARGSVEALLISLGAGGALLVGRDQAAVRYTAPPIAEVVSTVGSGDAMVAGVVAGLAADRELRDAVRFGLATGTAAVLTPGTVLFDPAIARELEPGVEVTHLG